MKQLYKNDDGEIVVVIDSETVDREELVEAVKDLEELLFEAQDALEQFDELNGTIEEAETPQEQMPSEPFVPVEPQVTEAVEVPAVETVVEPVSEPIQITIN